MNSHKLTHIYIHTHIQFKIRGKFIFPFNVMKKFYFPVIVEWVNINVYVRTYRWKYMDWFYYGRLCDCFYNKIDECNDEEKLTFEKLRKILKKFALGSMNFKFANIIIRCKCFSNMTFSCWKSLWKKKYSGVFWWIIKEKFKWFSHVSLYIFGIKNFSIYCKSLVRGKKVENKKNLLPKKCSIKKTFFFLRTTDLLHLLLISMHEWTF